MALRITQAMMFRMALANLDRQRSQLSRTQEQASSGLRINRPSDDPLGAGAAVTLRAGRDALQQLARNGSGARARVAAADDAIANVTNVLIRVRELAIEGANGTQDAVSRAQIAEEIRGLHAALVSEANTRFGGAHIFAGFATDAPPFQLVGTFVDPPPTSPGVSFVGDSNEIRVQIEEAVTVAIGVDGRRAFQGDADGDGSPDAGHEDLFAVLGDLWEALSNDDQAGTAAALPRIDAALDQLSTERTRLGSVAKRIDDASERLARREVELEVRLSEVQDADLAKVVSNLVREESALEAGLAAMGRLLPPTLMDFLR
ncbi:MAG: flagellar hook-associated protein FlgL [Myxococcota bacterium]